MTNIRRGVMQHVLVQWEHHSPREITWECESEMRE
jgi:hypothetical protein